MQKAIMKQSKFTYKAVLLLLS